MKKIKEQKPTISKSNFIEFLANSSPEEINKFILEKGKPRKLIEPMIFFKPKEDQTKLDI